MRRKSGSVRWMTPVVDWDWRAESSERMGSDERAVAWVVSRKRRPMRRRAAAIGVGEIAIGDGRGELWSDSVAKDAKTLGSFWPSGCAVEFGQMEAD